MLKDQTDESSSTSDLANSDIVCEIHNDPVMIMAVDVLQKLGKTKKVILKSSGNSIPNAVAVANIITENLLLGNSEIQNITVDSEAPPGIGRMTSTIEIIIIKK